MIFSKIFNNYGLIIVNKLWRNLYNRIPNVFNLVTYLETQNSGLYPIFIPNHISKNVLLLSLQEKICRGSYGEWARMPYFNKSDVSDDIFDNL